MQNLPRFDPDQRIRLETRPGCFGGGLVFCGVRGCVGRRGLLCAVGLILRIDSDRGLRLALVAAGGQNQTRARDAGGAKQLTAAEALQAEAPVRVGGI